MGRTRRDGSREPLGQTRAIMSSGSFHVLEFYIFSSDKLRYFDGVS